MKKTRSPTLTTKSCWLPGDATPPAPPAIPAPPAALFFDAHAATSMSVERAAAMRAPRPMRRVIDIRKLLGDPDW